MDILYYLTNERTGDIMLQYIGARYVTKIYENKSNPNSAEWDANTAYEPLTMVTYNNSSYLSKKDVPNTVGNPVENPQYWVQTGFYNGQILELQEKDRELEEAIALEIQNRTNVDNAIGARIDNVDDEIVALRNADNTLDGKIENETTARINADSTINDNITANTIAISTEATTRASADASLQTQIDNLIAPSGEAPSAAEVENARIGVGSITYDTLGNAIRNQITDVSNAVKNLAASVNREFQPNNFVAEQYNASSGTFTPNTGRATSVCVGVNKDTHIFWDATKWHMNYFVVNNDNSYIWSPNVWDSSGHIEFNYANNARIVLQAKRPDNTSIVDDLPFLNQEVFVFSGAGSYRGVISGTTLASNDSLGFYSVGGYNGAPTSNMTDIPVDDFAGGILVNTLAGNSGSALVQTLIEINSPNTMGRKFTRVNNADWKGVGYIKWVAYGDSITRGSYSDGTETAYSSHASYAYKIANEIKRKDVHSYFNCGVGGIGWIDTGNNGETIDDMLALYTGDKDDINLVTIALGINDYLGHNYPLGNENSTEKDGTISGNIRYTIRWVCENYSKAKVVVIGPSNSTKYGSISSAWSRHTTLNNPKSLQEVSDMIKYWCNYFGVKFIDELTKGVVNTYNAEDIITDGIHPTLAGQWLLAYDLADKLGI